MTLYWQLANNFSHKQNLSIPKEKTILSAKHFRLPTLRIYLQTSIRVFFFTNYTFNKKRIQTAETTSLGALTKIHHHTGVPKVIVQTEVNNIKNLLTTHMLDWKSAALSSVFDWTITFGTPCIIPPTTPSIKKIPFSTILEICSTMYKHKK